LKGRRMTRRRDEEEETKRRKGARFEFVVFKQKEIESKGMGNRMGWADVFFSLFTLLGLNL